MSGPDVLIDGFGRLYEVVHDAVEGATSTELQYRADGEANTIGWLVWHLTRVQDDHIAGVAGTEQVWTVGDWCERASLPFDRYETGYGQDSDEVAAVRIDADDLLGYFDAVYEQTVRYIGGLSDDDLTRVVDTAWDPPVTLSVRLVSVLIDDLQHAGQAAFIRGVTGRLGL